VHQAQDLNDTISGQAVDDEVTGTGDTTDRLDLPTTQPDWVGADPGHLRHLDGTEDARFVAEYRHDHQD